MGDWFGSGGQVGSAHGIVRNCAGEETIHVMFVYPADSLTPVSDFAAQSPASQFGKTGQGAPVAAPYKTGPQNHLTHAGKGYPQLHRYTTQCKHLYLYLDHERYG
jgi:hypothetical protein